MGTVGPNIFIKICAWSTAQIPRELIAGQRRVWKNSKK